MYQGIREKGKKKVHIASNREKKDAEFFNEKACTCHVLAIESVCRY